jgi:hypothetical protein
MVGDRLEISRRDDACHVIVYEDEGNGSLLPHRFVLHVCRLRTILEVHIFKITPAAGQVDRLWRLTLCGR